MVGDGVSPWRTLAGARGDNPAEGSQTADGMALLTVDRTAGLTAGRTEVPLALRGVRERWVTLAEGLAGAGWRGPSRCELWTAHDVLRHVRDACRLHVAGLRREPSSPFDEPFDARATPPRWLERSAGEAPEATLDELRLLGAEEASALRDRLDTPGQEAVPGPYGPVPWTVLTAHVVWDAWLHERDVAHLTGGGLPSMPVEDAVVAGYGLFIASMVAVQRSHHFELTVALSGTDRDYLAAVAPGHVELRVVPSPAPADLRGSLGAVVDSLAGRGSALADVLEGDPGQARPLTWLGAMLAPPT